MYSEPQCPLAKQLRAAIAKAGLNPFQVSKRTGVGYSAIHGFLNGTRDMSLGTASKLCKLVGLELRPVRGKRGKRA